MNSNEILAGFETAIYLIYHMPIKVPNNVSPFEILYNRKSNYSYIRVYGCLWYHKGYLNLILVPTLSLAMQLITKDFGVYNLSHKKCSFHPMLFLINQYFLFLPHYPHLIQVPSPPYIYLIHQFMYRLTLIHHSLSLIVHSILVLLPMVHLILKLL